MDGKEISVDGAGAEELRGEGVRKIAEEGFRAGSVGF